MNRALRQVAAVFVLFAMLSTPGSGQAQTPTTTLAGRVVVDDPRGTPLGGAIVSIKDEIGRARSVVTDDAGRFEFSNLPTGHYAVTAAKSPYVAMASGAKRPDRPGIPVAVSAAQTMRDVVIRLPIGAVVTGTLRDQNGEAVPDVPVTAIRIDQLQGQPVSASVGSSDDRGVYRIYGLSPGKYLIAAKVSTAGLGAISAPSTADVDRLFADIQRSQMSGPPTAEPATVVYAPTFFPGTAFPGAADAVTLASGDVRSADFTVLPVPSGAIEGVVQMFDGSPAPALVPTLIPSGPALPSAFATKPALTLPPGRDGRFKFTGVLPGTYTLAVSAGPARGSTSAPPLWGRTDVAFTGADVTGVTLLLRPGLRMSGRVVFEGSSTRPELKAVQLTLSSRSIKTSSVGSDGSFVITDIPPDTYLLSSRDVAPWSLRSAIVNGREVIDTGFAIAVTDITDAVVTFSDRHSEISGTLQAPTGSPTNGYSVVAFPTDSSLWRAGSRRIRSAPAASDGHYAFRSLPAGEYWLAVTTDVAPEDLADLEFLKQLVAGSAKVVLQDGESKVQSLRIARTPG